MQTTVLKVSVCFQHRLLHVFLMQPSLLIIFMQSSMWAEQGVCKCLNIRANLKLKLRLTHSLRYQHAKKTQIHIFTISAIYLAMVTVIFSPIIFVFLPLASSACLNLSFNKLKL